MANGYCRCLRLSVRPCVNHLLVRAITRDPFKLGSPNLNHRCERPWLMSLYFIGVIDSHLQSPIYLQSQNLPRFELVRAITHHPFKLGPLNLDQMCKIPWLSPLLFWGSLELDMSNLIIFKILFICIAFASLKYLWDLQKRKKTESVPHPTWLRTYMFAHRVVSWTVEQSSCIFSVTISGFPVLDSAIGDGFLNASVGFRHIINTSHAEILYASIRLWSKQH